MPESLLSPDTAANAAIDIAESEALSRDIKLVAQRDMDAFRRIYGNTSGKLFAICLNITKNNAAAQDVLQDAYLKVWDKAGGYDSERSRPLAWLAAIARNSAIDWYRAQTRHRHVGDEQLISHISDAIGADERIITMDREDQVWSAVADLDSESENELKAVYLLGLTYQDAAAQFDLPVATFKSRVRRTVLRIRERLSDD